MPPLSFQVAPALTLPRSHRLAHELEYQAVYGGRVRVAQAGMVVFVFPNNKGFPRLGLAVRKGASGAVGRNRLKRLVREAFRLGQHDLPRHLDGAYDIVVSVREGEHRVADLQRVLTDLVRRGHEEWERRRAKRSAGGSDA